MLKTVPTIVSMEKLTTISKELSVRSPPLVETISSQSRILISAPSQLMTYHNSTQQHILPVYMVL